MSISESTVHLSPGSRRSRSEIIIRCSEWRACNESMWCNSALTRCGVRGDRQQLIDVWAIGATEIDQFFYATAPARNSCWPQVTQNTANIRASASCLSDRPSLRNTRFFHASSRSSMQDSPGPEYSHRRSNC